ncbi:WAP domain-containing protein, partial [Trichonephila inaurata madagascariensis]
MFSVWKCPEPPPTLCFYSTYDYNCKSHDDCPGYQMCCLFGCAYGCVRPLPVPPVALETYDEEDESSEENNLIDTGPHASEMKNRIIIHENGLNASGLNTKGNLIDTAFHTSIVHVKKILMGIGSNLSIVDIKDNLIDTDSHRSGDDIDDNLIDIGVSKINYRDNLTDTKYNLSAIHIDNNVIDARLNTSVADINGNLTNSGFDTSTNNYRNKFIKNGLEIPTINIHNSSINIEFNTLITDINNNFTDIESNVRKTNIDNVLIGTGIHSSTMETNNSLRDTGFTTSTTPLIDLTDIEFYFSTTLRSSLLPHAPENLEKGYEEDKNQSQMKNNQSSNIINAANNYTFNFMIYRSQFNETNKNFHNKPPKKNNATDSESTVSRFKNENGEGNADTEPSSRNIKINHHEFMQSNNIHNLFSENPTIITRFEKNFYNNLENIDVTIKKKLFGSIFKNFIAEDYKHKQNNSKDSDCNSSERKQYSIKSNNCNLHRKQITKYKKQGMISDTIKQKKINDELDLKTTTLEIVTLADNVMKEDKTKDFLQHQETKLLYRSPYKFGKVYDTDNTTTLQKFDEIKSEFKSLGKHLMKLLNGPNPLQRIKTTLLHRISNSIVDSLTKIDKNLTTNEEDEDLKNIGARLLQFLSRIIPSAKINETLLNRISNAIAGSTAKHYKSLTSVKEEEDLETIGKTILLFFSKIISAEKISETRLNNISNVIVDSMVDPNNFLALGDEDLKTIEGQLLLFLSKIVPSAKINETLLNSISNDIAGSKAKHYKSLISVNEEKDLETIGKEMLQFLSKIISSSKINETLLNTISNTIAGSTAKQYRTKHYKSLTLVNEEEDLEKIGKEMLQFLSKIIPSSKINETLLNSISNAIASSTAKQYRSLTSVKAEEDLETIGKRMLKFFSRTVPSKQTNETLLNKVSNDAVDSMIQHDNYLASEREDGNLKTIGKRVWQFFAMFLKNISNSVLDWTEGYNRSSASYKENEYLKATGEGLVKFLWRSIPSQKINKTSLKNTSDNVVHLMGGKDNYSMLVADEGYKDSEAEFVLIEKRLLKLLFKNLPWVKGSERALNKISNSVIWLDGPFNSSVLNIKQTNLKDAAGIEALRKRLLNFFTGIIPSMASGVKLTDSKSSYRNVHTDPSNSNLSPPATYFPNFHSKSNDSHLQIQRSDIAFHWFSEQDVASRTVVQQDQQKVSNTNDDHLRITVTKNVSDRINQNSNVMYRNPNVENNIDGALDYEKTISYLQDFDALTDTSIYTSPGEIGDVIETPSTEPTSTGFRTEKHEFTNERLGYRAVDLFELLSSFISPKGINGIQPTTESSDAVSPWFTAPFTNFQMNNDKYEKRIHTLSTLNTMPISELKDFNYRNSYTIFYETEPSTTSKTALVNTYSSSGKVTEKPKLVTSDMEPLRFRANFNSWQETSDTLSSTLAKSYYSFVPWHNTSPVTANQNMNSITRIEVSDTSLDQDLKEDVYQKSQLLYRNPEQEIAFVTTSTDANSIYSKEDANTYVGGKDLIKSFFTQNNLLKTRDREKIGKQHSIIFNKGNFHGAIQIKPRKNSSSSKSTVKISTMRKDTFNKGAPLKSNNGSRRKEGLDFNVGEYINNEVERSLSNLKKIDLYNQDQRRNSNNAFYSHFKVTSEPEEKHLNHSAMKRVKTKHFKSNSEGLLSTKYLERGDFHGAFQLKQRSHLITAAREKESTNKKSYEEKRGKKVHSRLKENKRLSLEGHQKASGGGFRRTDLDNFKRRKLNKNEYNYPEVIFRRMETLTSDPSQNALNRPKKNFHKSSPTSKHHLKNTPTEQSHVKTWRDRIQNLLDREIVRGNAEFPSGRILSRQQETDEKFKVISAKETKNKLKAIKTEVKNRNRIKLQTRHWKDVIHGALQEQKKSKESSVTPLNSIFEGIQIEDKTVDKASNKKILPKHWKNVVQDIVGEKKKSTSKNKSNEMLTKYKSFKIRAKIQTEKQLSTTHLDEYEDRMDDHGREKDFESMITSASKNELSRAMNRKQKNHHMDFDYYPIKGNGASYPDILTTGLSKISYKKKEKYEKHPISSATQLFEDIYERRNYSFRIRQKNHDRVRANQTTSRNKYPTSRTLAEKQNQHLEPDLNYYPIKSDGVLYPNILAKTPPTERKGKNEKHPISLTQHILKDIHVKKNFSYRTGYYNSDLQNKSNENTISGALISEQKDLYKESDIYHYSTKDGGVSTNILEDIYTALEKKLSSNNSLHASQRIHEGFKLRNSKTDNALLVQYLPYRVNSENGNHESNKYKEVGVSKPKLYEIGSESHKNNLEHWPMESKEEISKEKYWWHKLVASPTTSQTSNTNSYKNVDLKGNVMLFHQLNKPFIIEDTTSGRNTTVPMNFRKYYPVTKDFSVYPVDNTKADKINGVPRKFEKILKNFPYYRKNDDLGENNFESSRLFDKQLKFKSKTSDPPTTVPYLVHLLGQLMKEEAEYLKKNKQKEEIVAARDSNVMYSNDGKKRNDIGKHSLAQSLKPNLTDDPEDEGTESSDFYRVTIKEPLQNVKSFQNNSAESFVDKLLLKFMEEEKQYIEKRQTLERSAEHFIDGKSFTKIIDKNISKTTTKNIVMVTDKNLYETKDKGTLKKFIGSVFKTNAKNRSKTINNKATGHKSRSKVKNKNVFNNILKNISKGNDKNSSKVSDSNIFKENIKKGSSRKAKVYNTSKTMNRNKSKYIHKNTSKTRDENVAKVVDDNMFKIGSKETSNTKNKNKSKVNNKILSKAKAIVRLPSADVLVSELLNKENKVKKQSSRMKYSKIPNIAKKQTSTLNKKEIYGKINTSTLEKQEYTVKEHSQNQETFLKNSTFKIKRIKSKPSMEKKFRLNHITKRSLSTPDPASNVTTKRKSYTSNKTHARYALFQNLSTQQLSVITTENKQSILDEDKGEFSMNTKSELSSTTSTITENAKSYTMKKLFSNNRTREKLLISSTFESGNNNKITKMYHIDDSNYAVHDLFPIDPSQGKTFVNSVAETKYNEPLTKMDKYSQSYKVPKPFSGIINQTTGTITSTTASKYNAPMLKEEGKIYSDHVLFRKKEKLLKSEKQSSESDDMNKVETKNDNQHEENPTESDFLSISLNNKGKMPVNTITENEDSTRKIKNKGKSENIDEYQLIYTKDRLASDAFNQEVFHLYSTRESGYDAAERNGNQNYITEELSSIKEESFKNTTFENDYVSLTENEEENQNYSSKELFSGSQQLEKWSFSSSNERRYNSLTPKSMTETERDLADEGLFSNSFNLEKMLLNSTPEVKYYVSMPENKKSKRVYTNGLSSSSLNQEKWSLSTVQSKYTTLSAQINESKPKLAVKKSRRKHRTRKNRLDISTVTA